MQPNSIYSSHAQQYKTLPTTNENHIAELNQTVKWTTDQMNQTLTEHHIAQYNILLIEDQTVNQTKHALQLGNIAIEFGCTNTQETYTSAIFPSS